jgi:hypothetical protein
MFAGFECVASAQTVSNVEKSKCLFTQAPYSSFRYPLINVQHLCPFSHLKCLIGSELVISRNFDTYSRSSLCKLVNSRSQAREHFPIFPIEKELIFPVVLP